MASQEGPEPSKQGEEIPRGRPASGRVWKKPAGERASNKVSSVRTQRPSWIQKQEKRAEMKAMKQREHELKEEARKEHEETRKRIEQRRKQREENERKSSVGQVISNTAKLKKLSKKQLRNIQKVDVVKE